MHLFLLLGALSAWIGIFRVQAAAVFAHFMVTNSENFTSTDWQNNMIQALEAHIDAFALNMAYGDPTNQPSLVAAFDAANSVGFQLLFSFDYAGNGAWPEGEVIDLIKQYGSNEAYYKYNDKPFVSTFEGPANASDWITIKSQTGCFFVPDWSSLGAKAALEASPGVPDALFSWAAWPWGPQPMNTYVDASYLQYLVGFGDLPYMMPVSPWFFTNLPGYKKNWVWNGDNLWCDRWQEVMYLQPEWVEIISWNDYGESHYIGPLQEDAYAAFEIGNASYNYALDYPHDAWRDFLPYVIDLYKRGTATVTKEGVTAWFRETPGAACSSGGTSGNTASQFQIEFQPTEVLQDRVFYSALLASPADVSVSIGGAVQSGTWTSSPDGDIGIYHGSVPFNGYTGQVVVTITRNGAIIAEMNGASISTTCKNGITNWNAWVGSDLGSGSVSATPELHISNQTCIRGTGPNKFEKLCGFSCQYGYCPVGACTCTAMGKPRELPKAKGIDGYPLAGEDASYSGLCSFSCNYGDCDPDACGTTKVELTIPMVSDFAPPACSSGSGEGNLAGLCSFACGFGFCPINACSCTGTGALVLAPVTSDVSGYADPAVDAMIYGPLCEFTCSRGYCPPGACATNPYGSDDSATPGTVGIMPLPCTSLSSSATFTLSAACTDGILSLPTSGPGASANNEPAGLPAKCHEVCDFWRMLTGTCCGQGGTLANPVDIEPQVVIPLDIPLPAGYEPNVDIIIPVPGQYDPDEIFGISANVTTETLPVTSTTTVLGIYTTTYTIYSTYPVTTTNSVGQQTTVQTSTPVITTSVGTSSSGGSESNNPNKPRKTCNSIADGVPLATFLAHSPLPSAITLPAGMCLPGPVPLQIPKIPLPNNDPPCYKNCYPCKAGACGGIQSESSSGGDSSDPNNPEDPDPTDPKSACENGLGPSDERGTCGNGNFPLWDSATGAINCEMSASEAADYVSDCQADALNNLEDTLDAIDCADTSCSTSLAKRGKCKKPDTWEDPANPAVCDGVFVCDIDRWTNVCYNVKSAIDNKQVPSVLTFKGKKKHNTGRWLDLHGIGENKGGNERKEKNPDRDKNNIPARSGWGLIGCEVEEYPFGNSVTSEAGQAHYNDRPTLRLIPESENSNHGSALGRFISYLRQQTNGKTDPTYCVDVRSSSGKPLRSDYCVSSDADCNNKCAAAYGPSFILVNGLSAGDQRAVKNAGLSGTQEWDLWFDDPNYPDRKWDHTLSWDPDKLKLNPPQMVAVTSKMPPQFPPSFAVSNEDPVGPGQKIYVGNFPFGSWELSYTNDNGQVITVGEAKARTPNADGTNLIWDEPPSGHFPSKRKRDDFKDGSNPDEEQSAREIEYQQKNATIQSGTEFPLPVIGKLSRRSSLGSTGFLDARVYRDVLQCPLDSDLFSCDDCSVQGPATLPPGAGTRVPVTATTSTTSTKTTSSAPTTTSDVFSPAESEYSCTGNSWECAHFAGNFPAFCDKAKDLLRGDVIYDSSSAELSGSCYTDGRHAGGGCGIFVKGDGCRLRGTAMQAAYDHLTNENVGGCGACGHVTFDNDCIMKVDYVSACG